jgi:hypothetical protein
MADWVKVLHQESWKVLRTGRVDEISHEDGRITYRTKIWDEGRDAFVTQTFNDEGVALSFLERVRDENTTHVTAFDRRNVNG